MHRFTRAAVGVAVAAAALGAATGTAQAAACATSAHAGGDWPFFGHDLRNTRSQPEERTLGAFVAKRWHVSISGNGGSGNVAGTPIVAGGCVYAGTNQGFVVAANADTGDVVWTHRLPARVSTLAYDDGKVFANVGDYVSDERGEQPRPFVAAMDAGTGAEVWRSPILETLFGAELTGSPTPYDGMLLLGVSGWPGEDQGFDQYYRRGGFRGSVVLLDQQDGSIIRKTHVIPDADFCRAGPPSPDCVNPTDPASAEAYDGFSGAGVWTTPAVDARTKHAYFGTGNPSSQPEHHHSNAILKVDVDRQSPTFGQIVDSYKGDRDDAGLPDVDFGASPMLLDVGGRTVIAELQKTGTLHIVDAATMDPIRKHTLGVRTGYLGQLASGATDGRKIFQPTGPVAENLWAVDAATGGVDWVHPTPLQGDFGPASYANGMVWSADTGILRGSSVALRGLPVHLRWASADTLSPTYSQEGGVSIARGRLYMSAGDAVIGYR